LIFVPLLLLNSCATQDEKEPGESSVNTSITLLFTNDFESAYDPTPAYWRNDLENIGGIAQLATLIDSIRCTEPNVFLFDAGDIYTGILSKLTLGELPFELMITMGYDAMTIGNHEFEYGWEEFARQKNRVPFPVLGANLFYKGTDYPYAQPYTIVERDGIRIGVIGILGQDAATALIPSNIAGVEVIEPATAVSDAIQILRSDVDLMLLLTHQGKTAPMQTNDEDPSVKRDIDADIELAGAVEGIDVLFGGHADAGTEEPVVHPETGTLIMQTYGQGFHLGYLQIELNVDKEIVNYEGKLIPVNSDLLAPHPLVAKKLADYRARFPEIYEKIGSTDHRINRQYYQESDLGNLFADILKAHTRTQIAFMPSGALRRDLPQGDITKRDLLDAFPFTDRVVTMTMEGSTLLKILEQSLTLERGMLQVSGLKVQYDLSKPLYQRVVEVEIGGEPLDPDGVYQAAVIEILAKGGDMYTPFLEAESQEGEELYFSEVLEAYFQDLGNISIPERGRLLPK